MNLQETSITVISTYLKRKLKFNKEKTRELMNDIIVKFCYYHYVQNHDRNLVKESWRLFKKEFATYYEFNLNDIGDLSDNDCTNIDKIRSEIVKSPIYELKEEYYSHLPYSEIYKKLGLATKDIDLPKIHVCGAGTMPHFAKNHIAELATQLLKKSLYKNGTPKQVILTPAGGTTVHHLISTVFHALDSDIELYDEVKIIEKIVVAELVNPKTIVASFGLLENTNFLHFGLMERNLSKKEDFISFPKIHNTFNKNASKNLLVIYSGVGKPKEEKSPSNNPNLDQMLTKIKNAKSYLFEINGVPYYEDEQIEISVRKTMKQIQIAPIDSLDADYKIILAYGKQKSKAIYNMILYQIKNPSKNILTDVILDAETFAEVFKLASHSLTYIR